MEARKMMMKVWAVGYAVTFVLVTTGHERHWLVGTLVVLATVVGGLWAEDKWGEKNHE